MWETEVGKRNFNLLVSTPHWLIGKLNLFSVAVPSFLEPIEFSQTIPTFFLSHGIYILGWIEWMRSMPWLEPLLNKHGIQILTVLQHWIYQKTTELNIWNSCLATIIFNSQIHFGCKEKSKTVFPFLFHWEQRHERLWIYLFRIALHFNAQTLVIHMYS